MFLFAACTSDRESTPESAAQHAATRTLSPPTATPTPPAITPTITATYLPAPGTLLTPTAPANLFALPPAAQTQIEHAFEDLADAENIEPAEIRLASLEAFEWSAETWNCTADDELTDLSETPTSGYRIVLEYVQQLAIYHTTENAELLRCTDQHWLAQTGHPIPVDPIAESLVALAQADAERRLATPEAPQPELQLASLIAVTWPDSSLGCPKPGGTYENTPTLGYRIVLAADNAEFIYHTSIRDMVRCTVDEEILPGPLRQALPLPTPTPTPDA